MLYTLFYHKQNYCCAHCQSMHRLPFITPISTDIYWYYTGIKPILLILIPILLNGASHNLAVQKISVFLKIKIAKGMSEILDLKTIHDYNVFLGLETQHPLVGFIDFSKLDVLKHRCKRFGFYAIFLKEKIHGPLTYGRSKYDYQEGTLLCIAPGQVGGINDDGETLHPGGYALLFHPDLIRGTHLARKMKDYTFFSYDVNEALHMSDRERQTIFTCFGEIEEELCHAIDKHSRSIIISNIEVLLNHCLRFYDRQFATREAINSDILTRFDALLNGYFDSNKPEKLGLPSVAWCADQLHFSANYFGDLVKKQTGKSAIGYIHLAVINKVKDRLIETNKTVSEIAYEVGIQYPHHLSRLFKKVAGCTPNEYRERVNAV